MVLRMMTVGAPHDFFRRAEDTRDIVDRDTKLQQHRCAGVPQNVRRHIRTEPGEVARSPPRSAFLRPNLLASVFDDMSSRSGGPSIAKD
jgi:hypothetical protein